LYWVVNINAWGVFSQNYLEKHCPVTPEPTGEDADPVWTPYVLYKNSLQEKAKK
jgi:hypothetical protein